MDLEAIDKVGLINGVCDKRLNEVICLRGLA